MAIQRGIRIRICFTLLEAAPAPVALQWVSVVVRVRMSDHGWLTPYMAREMGATTALALDAFCTSTWAHWLQCSCNYVAYCHWAADSGYRTAVKHSSSPHDAKTLIPCNASERTRYLGVRMREPEIMWLNLCCSAAGLQQSRGGRATGIVIRGTSTLQDKFRLVTWRVPPATGYLSSPARSAREFRGLAGRRQARCS